MNAAGRVRDLVRRPPAIVFDDSSLREATDHMVREGVGRLPVVSRQAPDRVIAILTRSDLVTAHSRRLDAERRGEPRYTWRGPRPPAVQVNPEPLTR
jgi:signal-transduction protein with cAMP-binding, CBS, and nucleotidyltransferase domain